MAESFRALIHAADAVVGGLHQLMVGGHVSAIEDGLHVVDVEFDGGVEAWVSVTVPVVECHVASP